MARILLPIQHNWIASVERRLAWPTSVIATADGREQRIPQRAADDPAEQLVLTLTALTPTSAARVRRAILAATDRAVWCPRWYDAVQLAETAPAGAGELVLEAGFEASLRDFVAGADGVRRAVLWRTDHTTGAPSQTELVTIDSVTDGAAVLSGATTLAWPAGSWLVPLLSGVLDPQVTGELPNAQTGQWTLTVTADSPTVGSLDAAADAPVEAVAGSIEIMTNWPNGGYLPYEHGHQYQFRRAVVRDASGVVLPYVTVTWSHDLPEYVRLTPLPDSQRVRLDILPTIPSVRDCTITAEANGLTASFTGSVYADLGASTN